MLNMMRTGNSAQAWQDNGEGFWPIGREWCSVLLSLQTQDVWWMVLLDLVWSGGSDLSKRPAHALFTTLEELDSILSLYWFFSDKFSVILSNIVTYCAILSNIVPFPAHQSTEEKRLSHSSRISSYTSSSLSPIGLKWRRQGKGALLRFSRRLWLPARTICWKSTCGPKHAAISRRPGLLTSRSTSLTLLLVCKPFQGCDSSGVALWGW